MNQQYWTHIVDAGRKILIIVRITEALTGKDPV